MKIPLSLSINNTDLGGFKALDEYSLQPAYEEVSKLHLHSTAVETRHGVRGFVQGHTVSKWQCQQYNPDLVIFFPPIPNQLVILPSLVVSCMWTYSGTLTFNLQAMPG